MQRLYSELRVAGQISHLKVPVPLALVYRGGLTVALQETSEGFIGMIPYVGQAVSVVEGVAGYSATLRSLTPEERLLRIGLALVPYIGRLLGGIAKNIILRTTGRAAAGALFRVAVSRSVSLPSLLSMLRTMENLLKVRAALMTVQALTPDRPLTVGEQIAVGLVVSALTGRHPGASPARAKGPSGTKGAAAPPPAKSTASAQRATKPVATAARPVRPAKGAPPREQNRPNPAAQPDGQSSDDIAATDAGDRWNEAFANFETTRRYSASWQYSATRATPGL